MYNVIRISGSQRRITPTCVTTTRKAEDAAVSSHHPSDSHTPRPDAQNRIQFLTGWSKKDERNDW
jgi:hypothetical protein